MSAVRDLYGFVICCHGRPMHCIECGEEYANELSSERRNRDIPAALRYALALMRDRIDLEAPIHAATIKGYIDTLAAPSVNRNCISGCAEKARMSINHGLCAACWDERREQFRTELRRAWEAGFMLCRRYGDNHAHFDGEQKEQRWIDFLLEDR